MIPCTRASSGCNYPEGECTGACMEFKPLEPRNLGNMVDVESRLPLDVLQDKPFADQIMRPDYKAEYEKYRYALKKMAQSNLLWIDLVLLMYKQEHIQEAAKKAKADIQRLIVES